MSVTATVDTRKLEQVMSELLVLVVGEVGRTLVDIADDAEHNAEGKWYTQVRRRTGKTGTLKTELRRGSGGDKLEAVVSSENETSKATYLVHRPGPLSTVKLSTGKTRYAEYMSYFRKNGRLPDFVESGKSVDGQPWWIKRIEMNPLRSDGKNLWNELATKEGKKLILARVDDLDAAMQRAADRLRQG